MEIVKNTPRVSLLATGSFSMAKGCTRIHSPQWWKDTPLVQTQLIFSQFAQCLYLTLYIPSSSKQSFMFYFLKYVDSLLFKSTFNASKQSRRR